MILKWLQGNIMSKNDLPAIELILDPKARLAAHQIFKVTRSLDMALGAYTAALTLAEKEKSNANS